MTPSSTPAPSYTVEYTERASAIRAVLAYRPASPALAGHVQADKLRLLDRIERGLAERLWRGGMSPDAAQQSAFEFVSQVVAAINAEQRVA